VTRPSGPFAAPRAPVKKESKSKQEPTAAMRAYLHQRDKGCVAAKVLHDNGATCQGALQVDHVRASGGLGMKSPATRENLLLLCTWHHKLKTEYGRTWRPLLLAYLERVEKAA
jgi:5-methylcytosine-specific restriction endonuclease McrA